MTTVPWGSTQQYERPVYTVVLYGSGIRTAPDTLRAGSLTFVVQNILVGQEDGAAVLRRLHEKAARGEEFTPADRVDLIFAPLMRQPRPIAAVLRDAANLTRLLPQAQQELTIGALLGLTYHYVDESLITAILEELSMANPLQVLIDEREARGEARGERQALRLVLQTRFGTLPESIDQRIAAAERPELEALIARAATIESLDAL